jgi:hypothetical protein
METAQSEAERGRQNARRLEDELMKAKKAVEKDRTRNSPAPLSNREEEMQLEITQLMVSKSCRHCCRTLMFVSLDDSALLDMQPRTQNACPCKMHA